jgi:hypothetical protein
LPGVWVSATPTPLFKVRRLNLLPRPKLPPAAGSWVSAPSSPEKGL